MILCIFATLDYSNFFSHYCFEAHKGICISLVLSCPHIPLSQKMLIERRKSSLSDLCPKKKYFIETEVCSLHTLMCDYVCLCGLMTGFVQCAENKKCSGVQPI